MPDVTEPTEELRLGLVQLLAVVIDRAGKSIGLYVEDIVQILEHTITDAFSDVKLASCQCLESLAANAPARFQHCSGKLIKPLIRASGHQHTKVVLQWAPSSDMALLINLVHAPRLLPCMEFVLHQVRVAAISAIGKTLIHGENKLIDDVLAPLAKRASDQSPSVRRALYEMAGEWLVMLPDRYSYFYKIIPLLLTGLRDEVPELQEMARDLFHVVRSPLELRYPGARDGLGVLSRARHSMSYYGLTIVEVTLGLSVHDGYHLGLCALPSPVDVYSPAVA
jgi:dynein assembly factor 5